MWDRLVGCALQGIFASLIIFVIFLLTQIYVNYPSPVHIAVALLVLMFIVRGVRYRRWLRKMDCWLKYSHEIPIDSTDFDIAIQYRINDQETTFYGRKA